MKAKRISPSYPQGRMRERRTVIPQSPGNTRSGKPQGYSGISRIAVNAPSKRPGKDAFRQNTSLPKGVRRPDQRKDVSMFDGRWDK